jgi:hypothetical protein
MAHLLRQPILWPGAGVLTRPPQRIAANTPASFSLRAPAAGSGLSCLATMLMNSPGSAPAPDALDRE